MNLFTLLLLALAAETPATDYTPVFENDWVRVVKIHYAAREKTAIHDHPATPNVFVYTTDGGHLRIAHDEHEQPTIRPLVKAGGIRYQKGVFERHWVEEMDGVDSEYVRMELKTKAVDLPEQDVRRAPDDRTPYESGMLRIFRVTCAAQSACPASVHPQDPAIVVIGRDAQWVPENASPLLNASAKPLEMVRVELVSRPIGK